MYPAGKLAVLRQLLLFYCSHAIMHFWCHNKRHQIKHDGYGVDVQCLTSEALESQKQKVSAN